MRSHSQLHFSVCRDYYERYLERHHYLFPLSLNKSASFSSSYLELLELLISDPCKALVFGEAVCFVIHLLFCRCLNWWCLPRCTILCPSRKRNVFRLKFRAFLTQSCSPPNQRTLFRIFWH